jgi:hypothetical protein
MADVAVIIDSDSADVHAGLAGHQRNKGVFFWLAIMGVLYRQKVFFKI